MISLLKFLDGPWEKVREYLRADLDHIEAAVNAQQGSTFNEDGSLQIGTIAGDSLTPTRYVANTGPNHTLQFDQVELSNGVKGRLPFSHLVPATRPGVLVGREGTIAGDFEEISLGAGLTMNGKVLIASGVGGSAGSEGPDGDAGVPGAQGLQGFQGIPGVGVPGSDGEDGEISVVVQAPALLPTVFVLSNTFVSDVGVAGVDNTAQTVSTIVIPANTLTRLGDRMRVQMFWRGDTGGAVTGTLAVNTVAVASTTDGGAATPQVTEGWLHYVDNTHAHIISMVNGVVSTTASSFNAAGFSWSADQNLDGAQDAVANNHIVVFTLVADAFLKR